MNIDGEKQLKFIDVHVNFVSLCLTDFLHTINHLPETRIASSRKDHPWCGVVVVVTKCHHIFKGAVGIIKEVSMTSSNNIGLFIELNRYDPVVPFKRVTFDVTDVVCYQCVSFFFKIKQDSSYIFLSKTLTDILNTVHLSPWM